MAMQPAPSAQRAVEIVRFLARHPDQTFASSELARRLGQSRATCQAVLLALEASDWVRRAEGGYSLGPGLIPIGAAAQQGQALIAVLRPAVEELHRATQREVMGCLPTGDQLTVVAAAGPRDPFSVALRVGQGYPLAPPFGLAFAAWDQGDLDRWIASTPGLGEKVETRLREAAALVRDLGYSVLLDPATRRALGSTVDKLSEVRRAEVLRALAHDEYVSVSPAHRRTMRVSHLSAPVFGPDRGVVALMGVLLGPDDYEEVAEVARLLCEATAALSESLAVSPSDPESAVIDKYASGT